MEQLFKLIADGKSESIFVLMPRRIAISHLRAELISRFHVIMGLHIHTVPDLLEMLSHRLGIEARLMSEVVAGEIITHIARDLRKEGQSPQLTSLLSRRGAQRVAISTLQEIRQKGISPAELRATHIENLSVLANLIDKFDRICEEKNIIDRSGWIDKIINAISNNDLNLPEMRHLFVSNFNSVPPQLSSLLRNLSRGNHLYLHLPSDGARTGLFRDNERLFEEATDWETESCSVIAYDPFPQNEGPGRIMRKLFTSNLDPLIADHESVKFHSSPSRFDEVESAAVGIKKLIFNGTPPNRIGLSMRELGPYDQFIRTVFQKFNIPYSYRRGVPILQSPPVRMAMKLAEIGREILRYDRLLSVISSSFMPFEDRDEWQQLILDAQIFQEAPQQWAERLRALFTADSDEQSATAHRAAEEIGRLLDRCVGLHSSSTPLQDFEELCRDYILPAIDLLPERDDGEKREFSNQMKQFFRIIESLIIDLDQFKLIGVNSGVSGLELLSERLSEETIREEQDFRNSVQVLNFFDLGYTKVDHLYVIGMEEGLVPSPPYISRTFLSDGDVESLMKVSKRAEYLTTTADRRMSEEQSFILALASAARSVHLYFPLRKEDGREASPSPYYAELQRLAGVSEEGIKVEPGGDLRPLTSTPPDVHSFRRQLARQLYRTDIKVDEENVLGFYNHLCSRRDNLEFIIRLHDSVEIENLRRQALFAPEDQRKQLANRWSGAIERAEFKAEIEQSFRDPDLEWSHRALQCFASCPFNFFLEYVLKARPLDLPLEESDPRITGILYHRILKKFIDSVSLPELDPDHAQSAMNEAIDSVFYSSARRKREQELPLPSRLWLNRAHHLMARFVDHLLEEISDPSKAPSEIRTEVAFGGDQCRIELMGRAIRLAGRFDRIDVFKSPTSFCYRIIDYKVGGVPKLSPELVREKQSLQLPLYILAATKLLDTDFDQIEASFLGLKKLDFSRITPADDKWKSFFLLLDLEGEPTHTISVLELVFEIIDEIRTARFPVEGRGGSKVPDLVNLVGRWLELPPELAGEGD